MKYISLVGFILLISLFFINLINGLGVGAPYSAGIPLEMYAGEEKVIELVLFNFDNEENVVMKGELLSGNEIAVLDTKEYVVPYQSENVFVEMIVKIPENTNTGAEYNIQYKFKQVGGEGEGMVVFSQGIKRSFDVVILGKIAEEKPTSFLLLFFIILLVILIIVVGLIMSKIKSTSFKM